MVGVAAAAAQSTCWCPSRHLYKCMHSCRSMQLAAAVDDERRHFFAAEVLLQTVVSNKAGKQFLVGETIASLEEQAKALVEQIGQPCANAFRMLHACLLT